MFRRTRAALDLVRAAGVAMERVAPMDAAVVQRTTTGCGRPPVSHYPRKFLHQMLIRLLTLHHLSMLRHYTFISKLLLLL
jgi:hypothetical protein